MEEQYPDKKGKDRRSKRGSEPFEQVELGTGGRVIEL